MYVGEIQIFILPLSSKSPCLISSSVEDYQFRTLCTLCPYFQETKQILGGDYFLTPVDLLSTNPILKCQYTISRNMFT